MLILWITPYIKNSGRTEVWGDNGAEINTGLSGSGVDLSYTVYGRIPADQDSPHLKLQFYQNAKKSRVI